jgi:hypothetical protein
MKRPKIKDMTAIELARFRCLQCRRGARRALNILKTVNLSELDQEHRAKLTHNVAYFETCMALTKPQQVATAPLNELERTLMHLSGTADH